MNVYFYNMPVTATLQTVLKLVINISITTLFLWYSNENIVAREPEEGSLFKSHGTGLMRVWVLQESLQVSHLRLTETPRTASCMTRSAM